MLTSPEGGQAYAEALDDKLRLRAHRLLVRLIQHSELLPKGIYLERTRLIINTIDGINERIGTGAYADVYKGTFDGQPVAVKVCRPFVDSQANNGLYPTRDAYNKVRGISWKIVVRHLRYGLMTSVSDEK